MLKNTCECVGYGYSVSANYLKQSGMQSSKQICGWDDRVFTQEAKVVVIKVQLQDPFLGTPSGDYSGQDNFRSNTQTYLPFPLSFTHGCTLEFSRGYTTCVGVIALMSNGMYALVLLDLKIFLSLDKCFPEAGG